MQLEIYQWLVPIIGLIYIFRIVLQYSRQKRTSRSLILWIIFWGIIILVAVLPNPISHRIASMLGFKDNVNAIIFVFLGLQFLLIFYMFNTIESLERKITRLVREIALSQGKESVDTDQLNQGNTKN